ncbi:MAG: DUF6265 family protein [Gammaproteobacteria bacterium]|nr:DUF6265 family protein [Gammaproteobacteria bacterium]
MPRRLLTSILVVLSLTTTATVLADAHTKASVDDLAWMTGSYVGSIGNGTLEENWIRPKDGSIAALVRITGEGATSMVELIVVQPEADSLMLHIQQWDTGFAPRAGGAQKMKLTNLGENTVSFEAVSEGGLKSLTYSRPTPDLFTVDVETADGTKFQIPLKAQ